MNSASWRTSAASIAKRDAYDGRGNEIVTYIVDRNINYTNVCNVYCKFCAFYRTEKDEDHYVLSQEQIDQKLDELAAIGGAQMLMQGGHHPELGIDYYLEPAHAHPREISADQHPRLLAAGVQSFRQVFGMPLREVITRFKEAGLGSIPGGGGEILVDSRAQAHRAAQVRHATNGSKSCASRTGSASTPSATMMFGHVETLDDRIEHLQRLRELQDETGGFTAFICWTFQPEHTKLRAEPVGSSEYLRMQALRRIFLDNFENVQSSWVTQGPKIGQIALKYGANDFGSVMMEENVVSSAGTTLPPEQGADRAAGRAGGVRSSSAGYVV